MPLPSVTVVIPVYNSARYITETIQHVLNQDYTDFEIVIIDDASTDGSVDLISSHFSSLLGTKIRILTNMVNRERSFSRNQGVRSARGEYVAFLDSDDIWLSNHLRLLVEPLRQGFDMSFSLPLFVDQDGKAIPGQRKRELGSRERKNPLRAILMGKAPFPSGLAVRKEVFMKVGGFDESLSLREDWEFGVRLGRQSRVKYVRDLTWKYRSHTEAPSMNKRWLETTISVGQRLMSTLNDEELQGLVLFGMAQQLLAGWHEGPQWTRVGRRYLFQALRMSGFGLPLGDAVYLMIKCLSPAPLIRLISRGRVLMRRLRAR